MEQFKQRPDSGNFHATTSKRTEKSPDYFGEIAINLKDTTNVRTEDGLHIFKINGWKMQAKGSGKTYLSIKVDRFVPTKPQESAPKTEISDDDLPF